MKSITTKTHKYVSIRTMASDYFMEKFHKGDRIANVKMQEAYQEYFIFYKKFLEYATGYSYDNYFEYRYRDAMQTSKEVLYEMTGIYIAAAGKYNIFCIPKTCKEDIYEYLLSTPCKKKILQKTYGTYRDPGLQTWAREIYMRKDVFRNDKLNEILDGQRI